MRRAVVALIGVLALVVAGLTAMAAATMVDQRGDMPGYGMDGMMSRWRSDDSNTSQNARGWMHGPGRGHGPGGWMHASPGGSEFAYLAEMVAHHEEAVEAARELQRSDRPQMRAFGASVVRSQSAQIGQMKAWLARWYPTRSPDVDYRPVMRDLAALSGDRLDRAFLQDMIPHHMMAVMMSQQLLVRGVADHDQVNTLAESIRDEQHEEIFQMQRWLADWFGSGWRHGRDDWGMGPRGGMDPGMGPGMMW